MKKYKVNSGLGGVFTVQFIKEEKGLYFYQVKTPGFESLILKLKNKLK